MTNTEHELLTILSDSIWRGYTQPHISPDVIKEAKNQTVTGLINELDYQAIAFYVKYLYEETELIKLLNKANIPFVILKGTAAALYYPEPSRRSFGDIDFLVESDLFQTACDLLEKNDYIRYSSSQNEDRHCGYKKDGITFEIHYKYSYDGLDIEEYIISGLRNRVTGTIEDHLFPMLPPLENGLVLLTHMCSHLRSGLGLRQVIDWMMYCDKVLNNEFWETEFQKVADEVGLTTLAITTTALCRKYLGLKELTWCRGADDSVVDELMESLLTSGNFGKKQGRGINVETVIAAIKREGFFHYLQHAGEHNWEAYHKHSWLHPFCWLYQIFRYLKQGSGRTEMLKNDLNRGNQRYELLRKLGI